MSALRLLLAAFLLAASGASAQDTRLQLMATADDSRGWAAVGRLDMGERAFCTATLIAPDRVLTAAHCLFDRSTGTRHEVETLTFRAGWRTGRAEAIRGVRRVAILPGYGIEGATQLARIAQDIALLELDQPIRTTGVRPIAAAEAGPVAGTVVTVVSYARDRAEAPSMQESCRVLEQRAGGVLLLSCAVDFGASGAPVLIMGADGPRVVAVLSAMADTEAGTVALGRTLSGPFQGLSQMLATGGGARSNARFIRPQTP